MKRLIALMMLISTSVAAEASDWKPIAAGLEYRHEDLPEVHAFRIHPKQRKLDLLLASDYSAPILGAEEYLNRSGALLVINGGFFDEAFRSLGLLRRRGKTLQPLRNVSWGIVTMTGRQGREPKIVSQKDWSESFESAAVMALQVGPRLVVDGQLQKFKEGPPTRRSAVGITRDGLIEIALSESALSLKDWAEWMRKDCIQALNLDGGGSSQLAVMTPKMSMMIDGLTKVPNALSVH